MRMILEQKYMDFHGKDMEKYIDAYVPPDILTRIDIPILHVGWRSR